MGIKVLICDDDKIIRQHVMKVISKIKEIEYIKSAEDGMQAIKNIRKDDFDIILMDIDMPCKSGLEAAKEIFHINPQAYIIFVTAFKEYALEAFDIYSFDYILKPFNEKRLLQTVHKVIEDINIKNIAHHNLNKTLKNKEKFIFKKERDTYIVDLEDIIMFEKNGRLTKIYTKEIEIEFYESFYDIEKRLSPNFFRTHKSYIVNINKVIRIMPHTKTSFKIEFDNKEIEALLSKKNEIQFLNKLYLIKKEVV